MNNPLNSIKSIMGNISPKQMVMNMIGNDNPMFNNLIQMAEKGDKQGLENFARNFCRERNIDFDNEFSKFMNNFK